MQQLRANTQVKVVIGPVVAVGDGFTPVTTLALNTADEAELIKHDAASVVDISAATFAAITSADGYYNLTLTTSHTDTEGMLTVLINDDSLCLPVKQTFMVVSEAAWDSLYVAKDDGFMDVNIKTIGRADTQETEASNLETACANYSATRGLAGTALPAAAADAAGGLVISDAGGLDIDNRTLSATSVTNANTVFATDFATNYNTTLDAWNVNTTHAAGTAWGSGAITAASIATNAIDADALAADAVAEINATVDTALADYDGPTYTELLNLVRLALRKDAALATDLSSLITTVNADLGSGGGSFASTTDSQEAIRDRGDAAWITATSVAVGSGGITSSSFASGAITASAIAADAIGASELAADAVAEIADAVWDEAISGHLTGGSTGASLNAAGSAGDPWTTTLPGSYTGSQAGKILADVLTDTAEIGTAGAGLTAVPWNASWDAEVQSEVDDAIVANNLDHLCKTATAAADMTTEVADNTILARILANGDTSAFDPSTDGLQPIRDYAAPASTALSTATWTGTLATNLATLASHDPGTTIGTSTLTQAQVTGGAYALNSASFAFNSALDLTTTQKASVNTEVDAALDTAVPVSPTAGSINERIKTMDDADLPTTAAAILDDTGTSGVVVASGSKTGYSLSASGLSSISTWTVAITGNITGNLSGSVGSVTGAVGSVTGNVGGNVTGSVGSLATQAKTDVATAVLTTQMTEAYAADGTAPTLAQAMFLTMQTVSEFSIAGTTITVKRLDGSTTAATFTMDSSTTPTSRTRAT